MKRLLRWIMVLALLWLVGDWIYALFTDSEDWLIATGISALIVAVTLRLRPTWLSRWLKFGGRSG